jgi:hypothetical protein
MYSVLSGHWPETVGKPEANFPKGIDDNLQVTVDQLFYRGVANTLWDICQIGGLMARNKCILS